MAKSTATACTPKATLTLKNRNGSKSRYNLAGKKTGYTNETDAKKAKEVIQKKGKRVTTREKCGVTFVYEGPKRKSVRLKTGQKLSGIGKRRKTTRKKRR